jgi:hypothetical protein
MSVSSSKSVGPDWRLALGGTAAIAVAAVGGLLDGKSAIDAIRVFLTFGGALAIGIACYLRPGHAKLYALACGAAILSRLGFPSSWDSAALLSGMAAIVAGIGALITVMPMHYRKVTASVLMLLHFGVILAAVTSPMYPPWTTNAIGSVLFRPYMQATYLTNAYHFYSPEPGPASQMWFCVTYAKDEKGNSQVAWMKFPRRPNDMFDPLALSYYRRLSLTMRVEDFQPAAVTDDMKRARYLRSQGNNGIPVDPERLPLENQYILPSDNVREFIVPSYVRHLANLKEMQHPDGLPIETIRVYRVIHRILSPQLLQQYGPFDPATYQPFYLGEFDTQGKLIDPSDPLLYWEIPIIWVPNRDKGEIPPGHTPRTNPDEFMLVDGVQLQTGSDHNVTAR